MAASLLPDSTLCFFPALSPSFFLRFLSCLPTFRVPPLKYQLQDRVSAKLELQCRETMAIRTKHLKAVEIGAKQYDKEGALFWTCKCRKSRRAKMDLPSSQEEELLSWCCKGRRLACEGRSRVVVWLWRVVGRCVKVAAALMESGFGGCFGLRRW